jgi:hypothetical protein
MLTNIEIERICKKLDLPIVGVFSKNELYNIPRQVGSYYINLMDDDVVDGEGNNGSHWVFAKIYCDEDRDDNSEEEEEGDKMCHALYFDSFGFGMPKSVSHFLKPFKPVYCNNREIQDIASDVCGWYSIVCDWILENKQDSKTYLEDYEKFLNMWDKDVKKNIYILKSILRKIWKEDKSIHDEKKFAKLIY